MKLTLLILALSLALSMAQQECNATTLHYYSKYSLGKQDELNRTFTKMNEKIGLLDNVTWTKNDSATYTIFQAKPVFKYLDSKQTAVIAGNDTIVVQGGYVYTDIQFRWAKTGTDKRQGTGRCSGISDELVFSKTLNISSGYLFFELQNFFNVTYDNPMKIERIQPISTTTEDHDNVERLINNILNITTLRHILEDDIDKFYGYFLLNSLHDEHFPIDDHFDYTWDSKVAEKGTITIPFMRKPATVDVEEEGLEIRFVEQVKDYAEWQCGLSIPLFPLNPKLYGGLQQFIELDFYLNTLKFAASKGYLNTDITRANWESRFNQFYVGDLYEVIPQTRTFLSSSVVTGRCTTRGQDARIYKSSIKTFNVTLRYSCELNVEKKKVADFDVGVQFKVQGRPQKHGMEFMIVDFYQYPTFHKYDNYQVKNQELARTMIIHSLNRIKEIPVLGSGWKISPPRDYPHFIVEDNYTVLYDSTHIEPDMSKDYILRE